MPLAHMRPCPSHTQCTLGSGAADLLLDLNINIPIGAQIVKTLIGLNTRSKAVSDIAGAVSKQLSALIDELTRKSALNEDELLMLKDEVENERRKSMADQQKIKKIEKVLEENEGKAEARVRELA